MGRGGASEEIFCGCPARGNRVTLEGMRCPECGRDWDESHQLCPEDGSYLQSEVTTAFAPAGSPPDHMIGRVLAGRYVIEAPIAAGGMGVVYRAVDRKQDDRPVAIKVMHPGLPGHLELAARFRQEAEVTWRLRHPASVKALDYGQAEDGLLFMTMELLEGRPLSVALRDAPLSEADTVSLLLEIAECLVDAHGEGIVHRDLKPQNIFLQRVGSSQKVRLLDFGIAKRVGRDLTETGMIFGTMAYVAPELFDEGSAGATPRSDLYGLGAVAYQCLTGKRPFGEEVSHILRRKLSGETPSLPDHVHPALSRLVSRLLLPSPEDRPGSAAEVVELLRGMSFSTAAGSARWSPWAWAGGLAALIVVAGLLVYSLIVLGDSPRPAPLASGGKAAHNGRGPWPADTDREEVVGQNGSKHGPERGDGGAAVAPLEAADAAVAQGSPGGDSTGRAPPGPSAGEADRDGGARAQPVAMRWRPSRPARVELTETEVTVDAFRACVDRGACNPSEFRSHGPSSGCNYGAPGRDDHPMNCVSWTGAVEFCRFVGARLPSESEWYAEASNGGSRARPWGSEPATCDRVIMAGRGGEALGCGLGTTSPVCSRPKGRSPSGLCDMVGNVWEWTRDGQDKLRVLRGGAWYMSRPASLTARARTVLSPSTANPNIGFRCARPLGAGGSDP